MNMLYKYINLFSLLNAGSEHDYSQTSSDCASVSSCLRAIPAATRLVPARSHAKYKQRPGSHTWFSRAVAARDAHLPPTSGGDDYHTAECELLVGLTDPWRARRWRLGCRLWRFSRASIGDSRVCREEEEEDRNISWDRVAVPHEAESATRALSASSARAAHPWGVAEVFNPITLWI